MKGKVLSWNKILFNPFQNAASAPPSLSPVANARAATSNGMLKKRARSKFMSYHIASELAALNSPLRKSYLRTLTCGATITKTGDKFTSTYCGHRWCLVCARIRTGKLMNSYMDLSAELQDKHFVTLTIRNVNAVGRTDAEMVNELKFMQKRMFKWCRKTLDGFRKYNLHVKGIRNFENKPAENKRGYRPHIHWLIDGTADIETIEKIWLKKKLDTSVWLDMLIQLENNEITIGAVKGELLIQLWLKEFDGLVDRRGQDVRKCTTGTEAELFKYETKFTAGKGNEKKIPLRMLDIIYRATRSVRTIAVTGFITRKPTLPKFTLDIDVRNSLVSALNEMKIRGLDKKEPDVYDSLLKSILADDVKRNDADAKIAFDAKMIIYKSKCIEHDVYRLFTNKLEEPVTDELEAMEIKTQVLDTVFEWQHDNWYCIATGQPLIKWELTKRFANFLQLFDSG